MHQTAIFQEALKLFAIKGYANVGLAEVAESSGVDEALLKDLYSNKEGLFKACLEFVGSEKQEIVERTLRRPQSLRDFKARVGLFVEEMIQCHFENPYGYQVLIKETKAKNPLLKDLFANTLKKSFFDVSAFFETAINLDYVDSKYQSRLIARLLLAMIEDVTQKDDFVEEHFSRTVKNEEYREALAKHISDLFLDGVRKTEH